jgi:hypothetical protein
MMTMIEFYKHITSGVAEYLLFLFILLVTIAAFINICKILIECIGEQLVKAIFAYKAQVVVNTKNPTQTENSEE